MLVEAIQFPPLAALRVGAELLGVGLARSRLRSGAHDCHLTVGAEVGEMRLHAVLELAAARLDVAALRLDIGRAGFAERGCGGGGMGREQSRSERGGQGQRLHVGGPPIVERVAARFIVAPIRSSPAANSRKPAKTDENRRK